MDITPAFFAVLLTAGGAPIASGIIWMAIDFVKGSPLSGIVAGREKLWAFIGSAIVVLLAIVVGLLESPPRYAPTNFLEWILLGIFGLLAFYNVGRLAMAVHDDANKKPNSLTG